MAEDKKGKFWNALFGTKQTFAEAVTVDGATIVWDGELAEGTELKVKTEDGDMLAPEGMHSIEVEGEVTVIAVDGNGIIVSVEKGEVEAEGEEEMSETQKALVEIKRLMDEGLFSAQEEIKTLKESNEKFKTQLEGLANELDKEDKKKFNNNKPVQSWKNIK